MVEFQSRIGKDGRLTVMEIPFDARETFQMPKGTILVCGVINGIPYRGKLLSRGNGRQVLTIDKTLQKALGYAGQDLPVAVIMACENQAEMVGEEKEATSRLRSDMEALTAIAGRTSVRKYADKTVEPQKLEVILHAGLSAPSAKNKRPFHFVVVEDKAVLGAWAAGNSNAKMLSHAPCCIVVCGDGNVEGTRDFLVGGCAAATQNMLIAIHALGLGGVWCGVLRGKEWSRQVAADLCLPVKVEPLTVIALGYPTEQKKAPVPWDMKSHIHYERW